MSTVRCHYCGEAFVEPRWPEGRLGEWDEFRSDLDAHIDGCAKYYQEEVSVYCQDCGATWEETREVTARRNPSGFILCANCARR